MMAVPAPTAVIPEPTRRELRAIHSINQTIELLDWDLVDKQLQKGKAYFLRDATLSEWEAYVTTEGQQLKSKNMEWIHGKLFIVELPSRPHERYIARLIIAANAATHTGLRFLDIAGAAYQTNIRRLEPDVWTYATYGHAQTLHIPRDSLDSIRTTMQTPKHLLSEWPSTAISGNDLLSSCLYSAGIVASKAGKLSPIPTFLVTCVMYLFRFIYIEVVSAIPLNGGSYNTMLNTTSKKVAAMTATLAVIAYLATGVVGAVSASDYLRAQVPSVNNVESAIGILFVFALLNVLGLSESAVIALGIFVLHIMTLLILIVGCVVFSFNNPHILRSNMQTPLPDLDICGSLVTSNVFTAVFFGFSSAMLGVTGFETAANFVEEQQPGIFGAILRNMWFLSSFFNLSLSILNLCVLPLLGPAGTIANNNIVLALMARETLGRGFELWMTIDGFIVLSGSVLTSYVGITGLVRRLACDRVMPEFLLAENKWRHTNHYIIWLYFAVAASLVVCLNGDIVMLSSVFSYAFLGLLLLFSGGAILFKVKRSHMPRDTSAAWYTYSDLQQLTHKLGVCRWKCIVALVMVCCGFLGTLLGDPTVSVVFALYFLVVGSLVFIMLERILLLRVCMFVMKSLCPSKKDKAETKSSDSSDLDEPLLQPRTGALGGRTIRKAIQAINAPPVVFFCKHMSLSLLNKAVRYVRTNEHTENIQIVHVHAPGTADPVGFADLVGVFDSMYPETKIDYVSIEGTFEPALVQWLASYLHISTNMMFIRQPDNIDAHKVSLLGVRVITS
ncbi:hypothetical protein DYB25_002144 [Aphanomyces astaci]|uniref:Transmembrane protein n=2 Tax=Aphanomyces astaci TaxID=112090 RepID=A0A397F7H1_APHAT|nr:hypothetical protein DYB25_002144 [Aphanomyces astaci]RHZ11734.1 hypothetical protein DYB31_004581 [Aphanomyces astaci]RHZ37946.1 hypothetical protein DYB26_003565 [Aphanomyces astaci]